MFTKCLPSEEIEAVLAEVLSECADVLERGLGADIARMDDHRLLGTQALFEFWAVDTWARLVNLPQGVFDPWKLYGHLEKDVANMTLSRLAQCYIHTRDAKAVIVFGIVRESTRFFQLEIDRRYKTHPNAPVMASFLDNSTSWDSASRVLKSIRNAMATVTAKNNWRRPPSVFLATRSFPGRRNTPSPNLEDLRQEALRIIIEVYHKNQEALVTGVDSLPQPLGAFRKASNPLWEDYSQKMCRVLVDEAVKTRLPLLSEEMEKAPLTVYNKFCDLDNKQTIEWPMPSNEKEEMKKPEVEGETGKIEEEGMKKKTVKRVKRLLTFSDLEENKDGDDETADSLDQIFYNAMNRPHAELIGDQFKHCDGVRVIEEKEEELLDKVNRENIFSMLDRLHGHPKVKARVRKCLIAIILEGKTPKEALEISGLSPRTFTHYVKRLHQKSKKRNP